MNGENLHEQLAQAIRDRDAARALADRYKHEWDQTTATLEGEQKVITKMGRTLLTTEAERDELRAALDHEIEVHAVTGQEMVDALAEVTRLRDELTEAQTEASIQSMEDEGRYHEVVAERDRLRAVVEAARAWESNGCADDVYADRLVEAVWALDRTEVMGGEAP